MSNSGTDPATGRLPGDDGRFDAAAAVLAEQGPTEVARMQRDHRCYVSECATCALLQRAAQLGPPRGQRPR